MTVSPPARPHAPSTTAKSRSAWTVLVWKKEFADTWKLSPPSDARMWSRPRSRCSSVPTATLAFFAFTLSTTLAVSGTRAASRSATGPNASTSGAVATMFTIASPVDRPSRSDTKRRSPAPESWS